MTPTVHRLIGCAPAPLAHYLKALGVLRIIATQKDPDVRGWWRDEAFWLLTKLGREEVDRFFLDEYQPTPFVSPWNKGSGFYQDQDPGLSPIETSTAERFAPFREAIVQARAPLEKLAAADRQVRELRAQTKQRKGMSPSERVGAERLKNDPDFKRRLAEAERTFKVMKAEIFPHYLMTWRGPHRDWMDAAVVVDENARPTFPSLLGTGGNDGRLDFTNNAMKRLADLFDLKHPVAPARPASSSLLACALWGTATDDLSQGAAIGQFLPGGAGGANSTCAAEGKSLVNPWDFVLMLEGAIMFRPRLTRRLDPAATSRASAPFGLQGQEAGFGTAGGECSERGEQWIPIWDQPASMSDVAALLGEGRLQQGRALARRPLDVARALARLGVARGVGAFIRYGYLKRLGDNTFAVPLGRVDVRARTQSRLIDDLSPWLNRLRRLAEDKNAPSRLVGAERRLSDAVLGSLTHDSSPGRWQSVLMCAADIETIQLRGVGLRAGPIPPLSPSWIAAADDDSCEWRLALALASAAGSYRHGRARDPVRHHWLPLDERARSFELRDKRLVLSPRVVMMTRDGLADLAALVERRVVEARSREQRTLPLIAKWGFGATIADLAEFVAGNVDVARLMAVARALMALRWDRVAADDSSVRRHRRSSTWPDQAWVALRLAALPWPLKESRPVPVDAAMIRRLTAGDATGAVQVALRRLRAAGLRVPLRAAYARPEVARRWVAALAFPISHRSALELAARFDSTREKEVR